MTEVVCLPLPCKRPETCCPNLGRKGSQTVPGDARKKTATANRLAVHGFAAAAALCSLASLLLNSCWLKVCLTGSPMESIIMLSLQNLPLSAARFCFFLLLAPLSSSSLLAP